MSVDLLQEKRTAAAKLYLLSIIKRYLYRSTVYDTVHAWAGVESRSRCGGSKKYHFDIYANAIYYTYNSIMNDKFMCLCFPEFSGKYVCDDVMCFCATTFLYSAPLGSLLSDSRGSGRKSERRDPFRRFLSPSPLWFYCFHRHYPLLHWLPDQVPKRRPSGTSKRPRKNAILAAFVKLTSSKKCIDPSLSLSCSRTCHDSFSAYN